MTRFSLPLAPFALLACSGIFSACAPASKTVPTAPVAAKTPSASPTYAPSANPPLSATLPKAQAEAGIPYPRFAVPLGDDRPSMGPSDAPVTIVLFSDFECPYCAKARSILDELDLRFPGKIRRVYRAFPLSRRSTAMLAALMAESAQKQGKFWPFYQALYSGARLSAPVIWQFARDAGLDMDKVRADLKSLENAQTIERDLELAAKLGVQATPVFFLNGRRVEGAAPLEVFAHYIDQELRLANSLPDKKAPVYQQLTQHAYAGVLPSPKKNSRVEIPQDEVPSRGPADAPVRIVAFSDFECPFCARGNRELEQAVASFPGKVRVEFRHLPLPFHQQGKKAARIAVLAQQKGKFWEFHDAIYGLEGKLADQALLDIGGQVGLSNEEIEAAILDSDGKLQAVVDRDLELARALEIRGTPAYFVNGIPKKGVQPELALRLAISRELRAASAQEP